MMQPSLWCRRWRLRLSLAVVIGMGTGWSAVAAESYVLAIAAVAPVLDGRLDEACWQSATTLERFVMLGGAEAPDAERVATRAMLLADRDYLYLGVHCEEPLVDKMVVRHREPDSDVWQDDVIEFMVVPSPRDVGEYVQFCVNPAGALLDGFLAGPGARLERGYDSGAEVRAQVGVRDWSVEMRVPLASLPVQSWQGPWYFHLARSRRAVSQYLTSLRTPVSGFHEIGVFAELTGIEALGLPFGVSGFGLGQVMYGGNACSFEVTGDRSRLTGAEIQIGDQTRQVFDAPALAIQTGTVRLPFTLVPGDQDQALRVRLLEGARVVQERSAVLSGLPVELLGAPPAPVVYLSPQAAAELELPVHVQSGDGALLRLSWEARDEAGAVVGDGATTTAGRTARLRLYWPRWRPGLYRLAMVLHRGDQELARREVPLRLVLNPWEEMR